MEREAVVWNCSCVDALKGTVLPERFQEIVQAGSLSVPTRNGSIQNRSKVPCKRSHRFWLNTMLNWGGGGAGGRRIN